MRIAVRKQKKPKTSTDVGAHAHRMRTDCAQMRTAIIKACPPSYSYTCEQYIDKAFVCNKRDDPFLVCNNNESECSLCVFLFFVGSGRGRAEGNLQLHMLRGI